MLSTDGRSYEPDNLSVVDTGFFPSISAVTPPSPARMASAIRAGDHFLRLSCAQGEAASL